MASITIVGAGIFGLSCAWELARRGARVRVIEARRIGAGSSGGTVGALAPHVPDNWNDKKAFQLDSLLMAESFWAGVQTASDLPTGYARTGRLQPVPDMATAERLAPRIAAAEGRWPAAMPMRLTDAPEGPLVPASPTGLWLRDGLTARLNPRAALAALAEAIRSKGGRIVEGQAAAPDDLAAPALWTTGAEGLAMLSRELGRPIGQGVKGQSALLGFSAPDAPQVFAEGLHIVPHADGTTAIGSTSENRFADDRPDEQAKALIARARAACPALKDAPVLETWAGIRPRAASRAPLLGAWPGRPGHYVANGGFKIGFGMAPGIAALMAELILTGRDRIPDAFRLA
ncbi:NAD(P)/FAD-dependent oxidoreductase [Paracoccus siganidrum]|uniref:FAD-binding oxidoreductase n=1 Tax=Paracoccus siganidrum TaxID=1276757 RepID=A0A419A6D3_9RHOB|nr:FAD-binding oxidoreductase [Paracoccus siganidrum]RJL14190.1 FAD-binding oxidoreductase [Paracoccus siganidrum]RMC33478.1 FAD-dependent oxidoreductase [Paracoccus siganidrum]